MAITITVGKCADLEGAYSIFSFGPIGEEKRICFLVKHENTIMFQLGCFWGDAEEAKEAVAKKYGKDSYYYCLIVLACGVMEPPK